MVFLNILKVEPIKNEKINAISPKVDGLLWKLMLVPAIQATNTAVAREPLCDRERCSSRK